MTMTIEERIASKLLEIGAVFLRPDDPFIWASGIESPIYCDNRLTLTAPDARTLIENERARIIGEVYPDCGKLMGTSTAGIAHAAITAHLMGLPMGYVRGSSKTHGRNNRIEGRLDPGDKVVVVEDLISTGGSSIEVVDALRNAGAEVLGVISIFTYGTRRADDAFAAAGVRKVSLCSADTLIRVAVASGYVTEAQGAEVLRFLKEL